MGVFITLLQGINKLRDAWPIINVNFQNVKSEIEADQTNLAQHKIISNAHESENIQYKGNVSGANNVEEAIDTLNRDINNLSFTGSSHDPLVTAALLDINGTDYGPSGLGTYLDGRLKNWEKRQAITSTDQPNGQPDGGIWYEELSSEAIDESGMVITNLVVQDDAPIDNTVLWGDT